jgi:hypothetical protein
MDYLPQSFSDQEGLLSNFIASGVDPGMAQALAFMQDPSQYMWSATAYSNSPESMNPEATVLPQDGSASVASGTTNGSTSVPTQGLQTHMNGFGLDLHHQTHAQDASVTQAFAQPGHSQDVKHEYVSPGGYPQSVSENMYGGDTSPQSTASHQWLGTFF